jgi:hypothetical protein
MRGGGALESGIGPGGGHGWVPPGSCTTTHAEVSKKVKGCGL